MMHSLFTVPARRIVANKPTMPAGIGGVVLLILLALLTACGGAGIPPTDAFSSPAIAASRPDAEISLPTLEVSWPNPSRLEKEIENFETTDRAAFPPAGAVLAVGSSSIRGWHRTIQQDLAPLTVIPRGFGGSTMYDLAHYADRVIFPYRPRAILIYEGDNDISAGIPPAVVLRTFTELVERIHRRFPDTRVYVLAVKPSPSRWKCWEGMRELNALLLGACEKDSLLHFVDVATPMLDDKGEPRPELYIGDRLHLSADGYALWTRVVREVLLEKELPHEKREP